jgi:SAM-dependent methyltransferase
MNKKIVIALILIITGCNPAKKPQTYHTDQICLNKNILSYNFSNTKPHKNILLTKEHEQWTNFIKANPEGSENKTFDRVIKEFFNSNTQVPRRAVNFGSGSGKEDIALLKRGWEVLSIDASAYSGKLISEKSKGHKGKSIFLHSKFIDTKLVGKYDLIMSFYSLPFENKTNLIKLMANISRHLYQGGILLVNFYGYDHDFVSKYNIAYGISQAELFSLLLLNGFKVLSFENQIYQKPKSKNDIPINKRVNWEILEVVAIKN